MKTFTSLSPSADALHRTIHHANNETRIAFYRLICAIYRRLSRLRACRFVKKSTISGIFFAHVFSAILLNFMIVKFNLLGESVQMPIH
ncbi:hypothetical protein [Cronobacter sakazakii]|uniref:hypothetical protein n=1 Tax=Cronobacter sakazakii TaxID=28141 RepID=UPI000CF1C31C|nr:hypothetical protein [Cronobacter sakazakii]ELY2589942.1 hypothetical protein [Cronobacter sakazakii]ELY2673306.1 hypothetical protein [Cronobacter sakazakii]ELY2748240.1 hypothetical protein [Cronobacter sakazakii]ELY2790332.1 hypothetical protein [Cronobacter sakazakii]ELY2903510.1 hypothetical protein [Cronobacter sakazakii]